MQGRVSQRQTSSPAAKIGALPRLNMNLPRIQCENCHSDALAH